MAKKRISQAELDRRVDGGAMVADRKPVEVERDPPPPAPSPAPAPPASTSAGTLAAVATLTEIQESNNRIAQQLTNELVKLNLRTKARITVIERNDAGGIDAAEIEIIS